MQNGQRGGHPFLKSSFRPLPACHTQSVLTEGLINLDSDLDQPGEAFDDSMKSPEEKSLWEWWPDKGMPRQGSWGTGREVN